jgi:hypothetical protein
MKAIAGLFLYLLIACPLKAGEVGTFFNGNGTVYTQFSGTGTVSNIFGTITEGTVFVRDTFTDSNGTALESHTGEVGATWTEHSSFTSGGYSIDTNRAVTPSASNAAMYYASGTPPIADYDVDATLRVLTAAYNSIGQGVAARVDTSANTMIFFRYSSSGWQLFQTTTGTSLQIGVSSSTTLSAGQDYPIRLSVVGTNVTGAVNGVTVCSGTTTVTTAGKVGLRGTSASSTTGIAIADVTATSR